MEWTKDTQKVEFLCSLSKSSETRLLKTFRKVLKIKHHRLAVNSKWNGQRGKKHNYPHVTDNSLWEGPPTSKKPQEDAASEHWIQSLKPPCELEEDARKKMQSSTSQWEKPH